MYNQKFFIIIICFVLFVVGCEQNKPNQVRTPTYCSNELRLLSTPDSLKKITIDYSLQVRPLVNSIEEKLGKAVCDETVSFGLQLANQDIVNVHYEKFCDDGIISCFRRRFEVEVQLNQDGLVLADFELIPIDSLQFWMRTHCIDGELIYKSETAVRWDVETPKDSIEKVFATIKEGYRRIYKDYAQASFSKSICELTDSEIKTIKKVLPYTIRLDLERLDLIPPPPPPAN
ncbi:MAG: hypothetical protein AAF617_04575 [Bacteroidota bacterium]